MNTGIDSLIQLANNADDHKRSSVVTLEWRDNKNYSGGRVHQTWEDDTRFKAKPRLITFLVILLARAACAKLRAKGHWLLYYILQRAMPISFTINVSGIHENVRNLSLIQWFDKVWGTERIQEAANKYLLPRKMSSRHTLLISVTNMCMRFTT